MQWMVDGPGLPRALKLVAAALIGGLVMILCPRMAARIVQATQQAHATHKRVQVWVVWVKGLGCLCCRCWYWVLGCVNRFELVFTTHSKRAYSRSSAQAVCSFLTRPKVMTSLTHSCITLQTALQKTACSTVDGPSSARAQKLVAAGPRAGLAASLHLRISAKIAQATRQTSATRKLAQVQLCYLCLVLCIKYKVVI